MFVVCVKKTHSSDDDDGTLKTTATAATAMATTIIAHTASDTATEIDRNGERWWGESILKAK